MGTFAREHGPPGSMRRREHGGQQPTGRKPAIREEKGRNQEKRAQGTGLGRSKKQKRGGREGKKEWHHRQAAHEQLGGGRRGKIEGGN